MPDTPRLTKRPFPPYRHVPGKTPHPRRDPGGYSRGLGECSPPSLSAISWRDSDEYLFGIDLFNHRYWWECHEILESLWHAAGHRSTAGQCLQAIIQCAVAHLKTETDNVVGARELLARAEGHIAEAGATSLGLDLRDMLHQTHAYVHRRQDEPARLVPDFSL